MNDMLVGQNLGRYHILEKIGQGGMAIVYKARDTRLEREVALKVIRKGALPEEQHLKMQKRFEREAISMAKISHSNIVKVFDSGDYQGSPYLVMDYLPGGTLKDRLGSPIPWKEAIELLLPIAKGLSYAHQLGVVHRDVKPANILFTASGEPTLSDFGIVKLLETEDGQTLTETGVGIGTPEYMAPEQGKGEKVDARADIYALGVVLYEMITGRKPFIADTPMKVLLKHITDPLPPPTKFIPHLPQPVEGVLNKALTKDPESRYQDMSAFIQALNRLLSGDELPSEDFVDTVLLERVHTHSDSAVHVSSSYSASSPVITKPEPRESSSRKGIWVLGGLATLAIVIGVGAVVVIGAIWIINNSSPAEPKPDNPAPVHVISSDTPHPQPTSLPNQPTYTPYPTNTQYPTESSHKPTATQKTDSDLTCPNLPWKPRLEVGDRARICTIYRLILRSQPDGNEVLALFWDSYITIIDGPKCGVDAWWWKVEVPVGAKYSPTSTDSYDTYFFTNKVYTGWVKAGLNRELLPDSNGYYLCP